MNKLFLAIIIVLGIAAPELSAQRCLPGMRGLQCTTGPVNGLSLREGFFAGIAFSQYVKGANRWALGIEYLERRHPYARIRIPRSQFTAEAGYFFKFLSDPTKTVFLSVGASAMAGYETLNRGEKLLPDGATINNRDAFLYGGAFVLEMETYLTNRLVLLTHIRERLLMGSSVGIPNTQLGIGLKWIIN
ncbi:MAG: conjugal transfer protein TraO [Bacteroidales bacterium]|nr:conjugal transfer protein TraO [Bacteroidales bacterium]